VNGEKLPPHDTDAEENVIGSLLIDGTAIYKIAAFLQPQDFYTEPNSLAYEACLALYQRDEAIDQITVAQELARRGKLEVCGGAAYLSHLVSIVATSLHIEHYAQIVYRLSLMRRLINAGSQIAAIGYEAAPDVDASLNRAEDILFKLRHGKASGTSSISARCWTSILRLPHLPKPSATLSQYPMCCQVSASLMNSWEDFSALT